MSAPGSGPPGWPPGVPPPEHPGWADRAVTWLLDQCPSDYRGYAAWRRHPIALAWLAERHLDGQVATLREAYRQVRVQLGPHLSPEALDAVMGEMQAEGLRLRAAHRGAQLVHEALTGVRFVPRL